MFLKSRTYFIGKLTGNPRGNLECGSAQPSLFFLLVVLYSPQIPVSAPFVGDDDVDCGGVVDPLHGSQGHTSPILNHG